MSYCLQPHGLQHTRPPCPSPSPGVCPSSCSFHRWYCPAISFSDIFFFLPSVFPSIRTFPVSHLFTSDDQNNGASAFASLKYSGLISLKIDWFDLLTVQETFRSLLQPHSSKASILWHSFCLFYGPVLTTVCDHWEDHSLKYMDFSQQSIVSAFHQCLGFS